MWYAEVVIFPIVAQFLNRSLASPICKAYPGSASWPSESKWASFNSSICGHLLQPAPPGAVCHPEHPTYNIALCPTIQADWSSVDYHDTDPISSPWNNWNNDSCLPRLETPCSGEGYPVYVVNATNSDHVRKGVEFAGKNNVRLIVKGTGHDYLGRSSAPNSLSIWTHHLKGIAIHDRFKPRGCSSYIDTPAITSAAGEEMGDINLAASLKNLTIVSGGQHSVGYGGFLTGGGHSALSATYGLAADQVLEMEIVTPQAQILTINECQNRDLFWAMRGGGGSTFGVITSVTTKAFPSTTFNTLTVSIGTLPDSEPFWEAATYILSQYPYLAAQGIAGYGYISPNASLNGSSYGGFAGIFLLPSVSPSNTSASLQAAFTPLIEKINTTWPGLFQYDVAPATYSTFYDWWSMNNGPNDAGYELLLGSRLLDTKALSGNFTALKIALQNLIPPGANHAAQINLVSGKGVWNAKPRGGSDAVNPAWRKALVHAIVSVTWPALDPIAKATQETLLNKTYVQALRDLAPDTGAYVNEAYPNEPNFQQTFWGSNYPRLLDIKRKFDPHDVFWCAPCVGNERWEEVGNLLCRV